MAPKRNKIGRNVVLKPIEIEENRLVTFSKRRSGIYKKAHEFSTLCGAEVGILIFSPSGKPYTYGVPNFEEVVNRFLGRDNHVDNEVIANLLEDYRKDKTKEVNHTYDELSSYLDVLKKEGVELKTAKEALGLQPWWEAHVDELSSQQREQLTTLMENLKKSSTQRAQELEMNKY